MAIPPFNPDEPALLEAKRLEYLREHDPAQYARLKEDQERSRLERLKQEKYGEWLGAVTSDQLRDELRSLESRRSALESEKPELKGRPGWPLQGPLGKQYAEVTHCIDAVKDCLIRRGEHAHANVETPQAKKKRGRHPLPEVRALKEKVIELFKMNRGLTPKELAGLPAVKDNLEASYKHPANFVSRTLMEAKKDGQV